MQVKETTKSVLQPVADADIVYRVPRFAFRLHISISALFLCLILPFFAILLVYIYRTNYEIYKQNAAELITNHNDQTTDKLIALLDPIGDSLLALAKQVRDEPRFFESNGLMDTMLLHLENNPTLVSVFVASDRGSFHQVQSMRENMVIASRIPPADAKFNFWIVDRSGPLQGPIQGSSKRLAGVAAHANEGDNSVPTQGGMGKVNSTFTFFKTRANLLDTFVVPNNYDPRERPFYKNLSKSVANDKATELARYVFVDEVFTSASTQRLTMNLSTPVMIGGKFRGMVGESFELPAISNFLKSIQISKNCESYVLDSDGNIIVSTGENSGYKLVNKVLVKQNILSFAGQPSHQAYQKYKGSSEGRFEFTNPATSEIYLAQITPFPNSFHKNWVVLTLAPVGDFLVGLNAINQRLIIYGGLTCVLLVLLTYVLSRSISRPIEYLTDVIGDLLEFNTSKRVIKSNVYEINILSTAVNKLRNTLNAFACYVPRDLVNDLLKTGQAIKPGGESRYMTIFFTDLAGFSTISEVTPAQVLLECVSGYLEMVSIAVKEESGTVDKYIGDAVMAFWNAPLHIQKHAFHACAAAVKSKRRLIELNRKQVAAGMPELTMRVGISSEAVLVGNVGGEERMGYTVMGDGVNVAARLEGINKDYGTLICISHATYQETGERLLVRPIDVATVKGRKGEIQIYELLAIKGDDPDTMPSRREIELCQMTHDAYCFYALQQYANAAQAYQDIFVAFDDPLAAVMIEKCQQHLQSPQTAMLAL